MRTKLIVPGLALLGALASLTPSPAAAQRIASGAAPARLPQASTIVAISIDGFPLSLDLLRTGGGRSAGQYHAEGLAYVDGSSIVIGLAPGFSFPEGGVTVDETTRISPELAAALGLPSTARLLRNDYKGTVYHPVPVLAENLRKGGSGSISGGTKFGSTGWEVSATVTWTFGK